MLPAPAPPDRGHDGPGPGCDVIPGEDAPDPVPGPGPHPLDSCEDRCRLRLTLRDGRVIEGLHNAVAGRHFLHRTGPGLPLVGAVEGPIEAGDIRAIEVVTTRAALLEQGRELLQGPRVPGREPVTRDDFEHRLQTLARAVAAVPEADWQMQIRLKRQFEACAERIALGPGKQAWMLAEARWARKSNASPTMADLWIEPVASRSCFARPRPQDFDPDPAIRRRRVPPPPRCGPTRSRFRTCSPRCSSRASRPGSPDRVTRRISTATSRWTCP
ncbi:hypothetical protein NF552_23095 (plasmid) [Roseomonas mucosa]|nr:hypothetical protein NF552_23095 [Roseomonas mucosa]